jgi:two-component system, chemotaxis family, sensor kinase CheA
MEDTTMENNKLTELVEQAASSFNILSPTDSADVQGLQDVLRQIGDAVRTLDQGPVDLRQQLAGTTAETAQVLQQLLEQDVEDTAQAMDTVSKAICLLQGLIGRLAEPEAPPAPAPSQPPAVPSAQPSASAGPGAMTISEEDAPLVLDFITESTEHVETAESALLELENHPADAELINKIFRAFHTVKGMAGFLNLAEIQALAHSSESLLDLTRKGQLVLAGDSSDVVFEAIDSLKKMLAGLKEAVETSKPVGAHEPLAALLEKLKAAAEGRVAASPVAAAESKTPARSAEPVKNQAPASAPEPVKDQTPASAPAAAESQPTSYPAAAAPAPESDRKLDAILEDPTGSQKKTAGSSTTHTTDDKIKVSTTRLDNLVNLAGELVIAQLMVAEEINGGQAHGHGLVQRVAHQGKIVRELQELSMAMRMVPVQGVFQKMSRMARDLSRKAGKQVDFITSGEETELDRTVVDKIADPLVHMVRNALDHGIEPSDVRIQAGKDPTGHVELRAFYQAGNIVIEMEDDGKGLDKDRIVKKAVEQGLAEAGQELSEEEAFKLIFAPGLSTAEKVTSISGRGVGMDVVKKNIEALRGRIEIASTKGKGTTFTIRLPLTLAVIDGQVVRIGDNRYIVPINSIVRSLRPTREQISTVQNRGEVLLERGALIPLVRTYKLFGVSPSTDDPTKALVVVVEADGRKCCLLVDDLLAQQQVVIKSLGEAMGRVRGVYGGAIMGDGKVTLILDIPGLVELAQEQ